MSVPGVYDCTRIQGALRNAAIVMGDGVWESIEKQLQVAFHLRLDPPCSTVGEIEKALVELLGSSADLIVVRMRAFLR